MTTPTLRALTVADLEAVFSLWQDDETERNNEQAAAKELVRRAMPDGTTTSDVDRMEWTVFAGHSREGARVERTRGMIDAIHAIASRLSCFPHEVRAMPLRDFLEMNKRAVEAANAERFERFRAKGGRRG